MMRTNSRGGPIRPLALLTGLLLIVSATLAQGEADPLARALQASAEGGRQEGQTQGRIDRLDDESQAMLDEYQQLNRELDALTVYDRQLERLVHSQEEEAASLHGQMNAIERTQQEIVPLTLRMVEWLERFLAVDHPFLPEERRLRVAQLRELMDRADVSIGEKYRRVLEAYQIEMEYARTIEAYRGELAREGSSRTVEFLRVGRVGLYYQSLDRDESGWWNPVAGAWETLPAQYGSALRQGLKIARKQSAPDLLRLPLPAPREVTP